MITKPFRRVRNKGAASLSEHVTFGLGVAAAKEQAGRSIEDVAIPNADNATAIYAGAEVKGAAHPEAAEGLARFHAIA
jgi:hypothetical protein